MSERILIVEDDPHISKLVKYNFEKEGFDCHVLESGEEVLRVLDRYSIDLIILDIMLPKMNGFEVCKELRQHPKYAGLPIIMLTARGEEVDRIVGLEIGADDYIVKPFSPRELLLRTKAVLRRGRNEEILEKDILEAGNLRIDLPRHKVMVGKKEINLTSMEFNLLVTLIQRQGRVQSREALLNDVWEMSADVTTRTVDTHIKRLRQKLGKVGSLIETVRGFGYRFADEG